eukprot:3192262-Rhodomonas_salina.1
MREGEEDRADGGEGRGEEEEERAAREIEVCARSAWTAMLHFMECGAAVHGLCCVPCVECHMTVRG